LICSRERSGSVLYAVDSGCSTLGRDVEGSGVGGVMKRGEEDGRDENLGGRAREEGFGVLEKMMVVGYADGLA